MGTKQDILYPFEDIGKRLTQVRQFFRESQIEFAKRLKTSRGSIIRYEKGERKITPDVLYQLTQHDIDINWLLIGQGQMLINMSPDNNYETAQNIRALEITIEVLKNFIHNLDINVKSISEKIEERKKKKKIPIKKSTF